MAAAAASGGEGWAKWKADGNTEYMAGKTEEAVASYSKALASADVPDGDRATVLCNRAQAFLKLGKNSEAAEDCTACLMLSPDNVKALYRRCVCLVAGGGHIPLTLSCTQPLPPIPKPAVVPHWRRWERSAMRWQTLSAC